MTDNKQDDYESYRIFAQEVDKISIEKGVSDSFLERVLIADFGIPSIKSLANISVKNRNDFLCHYNECCEQGHPHHERRRR